MENQMIVRRAVGGKKMVGKNANVHKNAAANNIGKQK